MKKLMLGAIVALFLLSCKKEKRISQEDVDFKLINKVQSLTTPNARKIAFSTLLDNQEKLIAITDQLAFLSEDANLSNEQSMLIRELSSKIPSDFYNVDGKSRDRFMVDYGNAWIKTASRVLGAQYIRDNLVKLVSINQKSSTLTANSLNGDSEGDDGGSETGTKKDCKCSRTSDWCNSNTEGDCVEAACSSINGCGFLLAYSCDGWCSKMLILL
ncbi:bacteriocin fulvocin C-related protein [Pedobacter sp. HDW13]|uniref:bacteriocin fulvocin C-related protein n=1 Tax=unclassified Pedobacter TaxID=2628915 RepID=UPI000F5AF01F|nr:MULTISPECIES: bacteriocin fulvocin C-related protein [unclassified Pedobacter]QIL41612.1 bacteriocin fulvocin C-related protein [Pedobacter sp. HDW13]RQO64785.1 hypothetical protein DBR40_25075 [Pedobacter sp. KBW01]